MTSHSLNVDHILRTMNDCGVAYLLIGGMNFLLRHKPVATYDIDIWIEDSDENRRRCERALVELDAEWGRTDAEWRLVKNYNSGWLDAQSLFCFATPHGSVDVFRSVAGLSDWQDSYLNAYTGETTNNTPFRGLSDEDMLRAQYALDERDRNRERIEYLKNLFPEKH